MGNTKMGKKWKKVKIRKVGKRKKGNTKMAKICGR